MNKLFPTFGPRIQVGQMKLVIQQKLGAGAFGVVYKVKDVATSSEYALKVVVCSGQSGMSESDVLKEIQTLRKISHPNVISIIEAGRYKDTRIPGASTHMLIFTEYCPGGNLNDRLTRASSKEVECKWIRQMAEALHSLHSSNVVHRDLKPENVLLTATDDIKIGDFGLAREFISLFSIPWGNDGWVIPYASYYMNTLAGSPPWMAPEVFRGHYNEKADVFSLGILFLAILERDFIIDHEGKRYYGAFLNVDGEGKVGIGYAMNKFGPAVEASLQARGSNTLWMIALDALKFEQGDRPSAAEICERITSFVSQSQLCPPIPRGVYPAGYQTSHPASNTVYPSPHPASGTVYPSPYQVSGTVYQSPYSASNTVYPRPHPASGTVYPSPYPASNTVYPSPHPASGTVYPSPHPASGTVYPSPHPASSTVYPSPYQASGTVYPSPHPASGTVYPSPHPASSTVYPSPYQASGTVYQSPPPNP